MRDRRVRRLGRGSHGSQPPRRRGPPTRPGRELVCLVGEGPPAGIHLEQHRLGRLAGEPELAALGVVAVALVRDHRSVRGLEQPLGGHGQTPSSSLSAAGSPAASSASGRAPATGGVAATAGSRSTTTVRLPSPSRRARSSSSSPRCGSRASTAAARQASAAATARSAPGSDSSADNASVSPARPARAPPAGSPPAPRSRARAPASARGPSAPALRRRRARGCGTGRVRRLVRPLLELRGRRAASAGRGARLLELARQAFDERCHGLAAQRQPLARGPQCDEPGVGALPAAGRLGERFLDGAALGAEARERRVGLGGEAPLVRGETGWARRARSPPGRVSRPLARGRGRSHGRILERAGRLVAAIGRRPLGIGELLAQPLLEARGRLAPERQALARALKAVERAECRLAAAAASESSSSACCAPRARPSASPAARRAIAAAARRPSASARRSATAARSSWAMRARRPAISTASFSARSAAVACRASGRSRLRTSSSTSRARSTWVATRASFSSARCLRRLNFRVLPPPRAGGAGPPASTPAPPRPSLGDDRVHRAAEAHVGQQLDEVRAANGSLLTRY